MRLTVETERRSAITTISSLPHPLHRLEWYRIILEVVRYFSCHYTKVIYIPVMADSLLIPLEQIEFAFDHHRKTTAVRALLEYRLNRLCDQMSEHPSGAIGGQVRYCGLGSLKQANAAFEEYFGIDIYQYHRQCFLAAVTRDLDRCKDRDCVGDDWVSDLSVSVTKETRFHRGD